MTSRARNQAILDAAMLWFQAREQNRCAKEALYTFRADDGYCLIFGMDMSYCVSQRPYRPDDWCENCQDSQRLWKERQRTARILGNATRRLMKACKQEYLETITLTDEQADRIRQAVQAHSWKE